MKNISTALLTAAVLAGCASGPRKPDCVEVLHAQPVTEEYTVKAGDTINKIAKEHNIDPEDLVALNNLEPPYTIAVGQKLKVDSENSDMIIVKQIFYN